MNKNRHYQTLGAGIEPVLSVLFVIPAVNHFGPVPALKPSASSNPMLTPPPQNPCHLRLFEHSHSLRSAPLAQNRPPVGRDPRPGVPLPMRLDIPNPHAIRVNRRSFALASPAPPAHPGTAPNPCNLRIFEHEFTPSARAILMPAGQVPRPRRLHWRQSAFIRGSSPCPSRPFRATSKPPSFEHI